MTAVLGVVLRVNGLVPQLDLILKALQVHARDLAELFKRIRAEEVLPELELLFGAFVVPGRKTDQRADLILRAGRVIDLLIHEDDVVAARVAREVRRDVADAFVFRDEALTVLINQNAARLREVPEAAVGSPASRGHNAAGVGRDVLHVGDRRSDITHGDTHRGAVVRGAANRDALASHGRNPEVERLRGAGDAAGRHDDALKRADVVLLTRIEVRRLNTEHFILLRVEVDLRERRAFVDLDLAVRDLLRQHVDVVFALIAVLTHSAEIAVARILFEVMLRETMVLEPVKGFAGMLREEFHRFFKRHIAAVIHDVVREFLPGVLRVLTLLDRGAVGGEEAAAHAGRGVVGAVGLIENDDLPLLVIDLAGSHEASAAGTKDDHVNGLIPMLRSGSGLRRGGKRRGGCGGSAGSGRGLQEITAGQNRRHGLLPLELTIGNRVAVAADVVTRGVHRMALRALNAAHMGVMRVELFARLRGLLRESFVRTVALEAGLLRRGGLLGLPGVAGFALHAGMGPVDRHTLSESGRGREEHGSDRRGKRCFEPYLHIRCPLIRLSDSGEYC